MSVLHQNNLSTNPVMSYVAGGSRIGGGAAEWAIQMFAPKSVFFFLFFFCLLQKLCHRTQSWMFHTKQRGCGALNNSGWKANLSETFLRITMAFLGIASLHNTSKLTLLHYARPRQTLIFEMFYRCWFQPWSHAARSSVVVAGVKTVVPNYCKYLRRLYPLQLKK